MFQKLLDYDLLKRKIGIDQVAFISNPKNGKKFFRFEITTNIIIKIYIYNITHNWKFKHASNTPNEFTRRI